MATTQHRSVEDMVCGLTEDQAFADAFAKRVEARRLVKQLAVLRNRAGLSQQGLAQKIGCTQSKVSKLENGLDMDLRLGDLVDYVRAIGHGVSLRLPPQGQTIVDEVKEHAGAIKGLLDDLVQLAGDDPMIQGGVVRFLVEAAVNLRRLVQSAAAGLPPLAPRPPQPLRVETAEQGDAAPGEGESPADAVPEPAGACRA